MKDFFIGNIEDGDYGRTLYINPLPQKICTFDCVFCPLVQRTAIKTDKSTYFAGTKDFLIQLRNDVFSGDIEAVFISANGEALVNKELVDIIKLIKEADCKAIIISNGYVFGYEEYMSVLNHCDVVIGELMVTNEKDFQKLLRPIDGFTLEQHIVNMENFKKQYNGKFELTITILKGYSDNEDAISFYKNAIKRINPDTVEVETPYNGKLKSAFGVEEDTIKYFKRELSESIDKDS